METRSGRVVSLTASTRAQNEGSHATAVEAGPLGICPPPLLSPQVTLTGAMAMMDSHEMTTDTKLLAVADSPLSFGTHPPRSKRPPHIPHSTPPIPQYLQMIQQYLETILPEQRSS